MIRSYYKIQLSRPTKPVQSFEMWVAYVFIDLYSVDTAWASWSRTVKWSLRILC